MAIKINQPLHPRLNWKLLSVIGIVAVVLIVICLELTNTTYLFHKRKAVSGTIPASTQSDTSDKTNADNTGSEAPLTDSTDGSAPISEKTTGPPSNGPDLLAPSGSFVSNHRPSLENSPGEESVCVTTPGAICTITFTMGDVVKTLEAKKAAGSGTVIWNWDVKSAGFVGGSWQIITTSSLNGQTKNTTDLQNLEVQP